MRGGAPWATWQVATKLYAVIRVYSLRANYKDMTHAKFRPFVRRRYALTDIMCSRPCNLLNCTLKHTNTTLPPQHAHVASHTAIPNWLRFTEYAQTIY